MADLGAVVDGLEVARANRPGHSTRLAARDRWHITLAFLGDVPADRTDGPSPHSTPRPGRLSGAGSSIRFAGGGTFGRGGFTILWAGLGGDLDALRGLAAAVRTQLRRQRVSFDQKGFRPHLTISRPGARVEQDTLQRDVDRLRAYEGPEWTVTNMHLVASELGPQPVYTTVHSVDF